MNEISQIKPKRRGRPVAPLITRQAATRAAIELIDRDGLAALSVQGVARRMDVSGPSLYYHFRDKDDLLRQVARELLREIGERVAPGTNWRDRAMQLSIATRRVILTHPKAAALMLHFFPRNLMLGAYEETLRDCPYPARHHKAILEALEKLAYGASLFAAAARTRNSAAMPDVDAANFPHLAEAMMLASADDEELFIETLNILFDGFTLRYGENTDMEIDDV